MIKVKFRKTKPEAIQPTYATDGSACMDLYAMESHKLDGLHGKRSAVIDTGIAFEIPRGYVMTMHSRSGHAFDHGVRLSNSTGIIDSDFRGSVKVMLTIDSISMLEIDPGDRIAQAMIIPIPLICLEEVSELGETARGLGGMGSTGA